MLILLALLIVNAHTNNVGAENLDAEVVFSSSDEKRNPHCVLIETEGDNDVNSELESDFDPNYVMEDKTNHGIGNNSDELSDYEEKFETISDVHYDENKEIK